MLVPIESYSAYLATWAERAKAAGYFDTEYDPETDRMFDGFGLYTHTMHAIEAWSSPTGLNHAPEEPRAAVVFVL